MTFYKTPADYPSDAGATAVIIGVLDGVHLGHQSLLAIAHAHSVGRRVVALTFDPHPGAVLGHGAPPMLLPLEARLRRLHNVGADDVVVLPFDIARSGQDPADFVREVLVDELHAGVVVVGENFRFGRKASGDVALLRELGEQHFFRVIPAPTVIVDDEVVSSTRVRHAVADGAVDSAAALLGRPHRVYGPVVRGDQRGRELGYPTANLAIEPGIAVPTDGVYAGWLVLDPDSHGEQHLPAAISVGANVTFDGVEPRVEAYALDRTDLELYDTHLAVEFARRIRPMVKFDGVDDLLVAMAADVAEARTISADRRAWLVP